MLRAARRQNQSVTLIVTLFSPLGVVQASDSFLTCGDGNHAGSAPKLFAVPGQNAVLAFAGCYAVGGEALDSWMPRILADCGAAPTLAATATALTDRLQAAVLPEEVGGGVLIHLAGYENGADGVHPELWFIRNIHHMLEDGGYSEPETEFLISEDLWSRDRPDSPAADLQIYANGMPSGRITFMAVTQLLMQFLRQVWGYNAWQFRAPTEAAELGALAEFLVRAITLLFELSDYPGPPVGGDVQTEVLTAPDGAGWTPAPA